MSDFFAKNCPIMSVYTQLTSKSSLVSGWWLLPSPESPCRRLVFILYTVADISGRWLFSWSKNSSDKLLPVEMMGMGERYSLSPSPYPLTLNWRTVSFSSSLPVLVPPELLSRIPPKRKHLPPDSGHICISEVILDGVRRPWRLSGGVAFVQSGQEWGWWHRSSKLLLNA